MSVYPAGIVIKIASYPRPARVLIPARLNLEDSPHALYLSLGYMEASLFRDYNYRHCNALHCPTEQITSSIYLIRKL